MLHEIAADDAPRMLVLAKADRIDPDGAVVEERWTYNQGAMVGAGLLLAEATGDPGYLAQATATAAAALRRFDLDRLA